MKPANYPLHIVRGAAFGPVEFHCKTQIGGPTDLAGYSVHAQARPQPGKSPVIDLQPVISDAAGGVITLPALSDEQTMAIPVGNYRWDLMLENAAGDRLGPYIAGPVIVADIVTQAG